MLKANVPGGIVSGSTAAVTLTGTASGNSTSTMSNGIVSIVCTKSSGQITTLNYTYNNGTGTQTINLLSGNTNGGKLYWENSNNQGLAFTYSVVADPSANGGDYAEIALSTTSEPNSVLEVHYSMRRGSPGFYVTAIWRHRSTDGEFGMGECRNNIYAGSIFNWMSVDDTRNKLMQVSGGTSIGVPTAPVECSLWTNGIYKGQYEDKYKYSAPFGTQRVWGWSSVGASGKNVGLWDVSASAEYYNGGPLKQELMCHLGTTILNMFNGGHFGMGTDGTLAAGEVWNKVCGPYFVYCNSVPNSNLSNPADPVEASRALYNDAKAQALAEQGIDANGQPTGASGAWPYSWFVNPNYASAANRGAVTGKIVINDSYNPNASAANTWVGVIQQPATTTSTYDFQQWVRPYQFWVRTDANGIFTIPAVISGTNYTLYAFGPGTPGTFMSQAQTGGSPPFLEDIPASPFSVTVTNSGTTTLGNVTWTPTRVGPTVFEIGYPDRTARKFRHGEDWWVGDIGASPTAPSPVWSKWLEYPFDFPTGPIYLVGTSRWTTDWNFCQPVVLGTSGNWNNSSSTITFTLSSGTSLSGTASLLIGLASNYYAAIIVKVNNTVLVSNGSTITATPSSLPSTGFVPSSSHSDSTIRESINGAFSDERINFPANLLNTGTTGNTITLGIRQVGGSYFADHAMYDYIRLELTGYVPPAPTSVAAYAGNNSVLLSWPVKPGATRYNILRSVTSGTNYSSIASGVTGPVSGSGPTNATLLDTTATNGTAYYYVVRSVNTTGTSGNSPQSSGVTPSAGAPAAAPAAPTGVTATGTNGSVTVAWNASAGANYYTVQRSTLVANGGGTYNTLGTIILSNTVTGTTYIDNSPTNASTYSYAVLASNATGTGTASTPASAVPLPAAPTTAPATLTATPGAGEVTLNWSDVAGATGYIVQVATTPGGPYTYLATVSYLTHTDTGNADNTTYYYVVAATNSGGTSANSAEASATTAPAAPTGLTATPGNSQITLTWNASTAATGYVVERGTSTGGPYTYVGSSNGTTYTNNSLTNGTTYYYVVAAFGASGSGFTSPEASATPTATVPVAPASLTATAGYLKIVLNWASSSGATSYNIYRGTDSGGPYPETIASGITATSATNTGLAYDTAYYYVVAATGTGGTGAYSNEASATPFGSPRSLTWTGTTSTAWDTATANWLNGTSAVTFADGDSATFNDTATSPVVVITGTANPAAVTFNNSTLTYSMGGSGGGLVSGSTGLVKTGSGTLTINNVNTYTGGTTINGGTLALGVTGVTGATLGSGTIHLNQGGVFRMADSTGHNFPSNAIQIAAGAGATLSSASLTNGYGGAISGSIDSTLTLSGSLSFSVSGTAQFAAFNGIVVIPSGSQLRFSASSSTPGANGNGGSDTSFQVDGKVNTRNSSGAGGVVLGSLAGAGRLEGQSNTPTGIVIYFVGAKDLDSTFSGVIANGGNGTAALTKIGNGTLTLSGSNTYTGPTTVNGGVLKITGTCSGSTSLTVANGATLYLAAGTLSVSGAITNNGTFKLSGATVLASTGAFTNNGILDLINGSSSLPSNFVNHGTVLDSSTVKVQQVTVTGTNFNLSIQSYPQHNYQLQRADSLTAPAWTNIGYPQPGTGSPLNLTDIGGATGTQRFYRVQVTP